jgi:hypothetical protein
MTGDVSRGILTLDVAKRSKIEKAWFGEPGACRSNQRKSAVSTSANLSFGSFGGLFIVTGVTSGLTLLLYLARFTYRERDEIRAAEATAGSGSVSMRRLRAWVQHYDRKHLRNGNDHADRRPQWTVEIPRKRRRLNWVAR